MSLEAMFNDDSLYSKREFKLFNLAGEKFEFDENEARAMVDYIGYNTNKIVSFCNKCEKEFPFDVEKRTIGFLYGSSGTTQCVEITYRSNNNMVGALRMTDGLIGGLQPPYHKLTLLPYNKSYLLFELTCTNNEYHKYLMVVSIEQRLNTFIIKKIGQDPSMLEVHGYDFDRYKNILKKFNAYSDYKKADLSKTDNFYVGAYAYLRRIFEKMLNWYVEQNSIILEDNHVDTKIKAVKEFFDPRINEMLKNLYGILSKSIHELDEDQSETYYDYLKAVIDIQLEYEFTEMEKDKQTKKLKSVLDKIANEIR